MPTRKSAPALAAGCTMVLKPAEQTPLSALAVAALAEEAGLPPGVFSVVTGDAEDAPAIGGEMTSNPIVRKLGFTGSTEVGKLLMAQCARQVKKVSLELGGNAPFIVFDDADLDAAVAGAIVCKFRNSGQTCISANRMLVQDGIYDEFLAAFTDAVSRLKVADGFDAGVNVGPLIDEPAIEKVERHVGDARRAAAPRSSLGGARHRGPVLPAVDPHRRHGGDGDELRGDVRPGRRHRPLLDRGGGDRGSPTTRRTGSPRTSTAATSAGSGASARRSSTASSASTRASSRPRWRRSAASRSPASAARARGTASTSGSSSSTGRSAA